MTVKVAIQILAGQSAASNWSQVDEARRLVGEWCTGEANGPIVIVGDLAATLKEVRDVAGVLRAIDAARAGAGDLDTPTVIG